MKYWKTTIDEIRIVCKKCNQCMVIESSRNLTNGIFGCNKCKDRVNLMVFPKEKEVKKGDIDGD